MTLDDSFNEEDDMKLDVDGITVVIDKSLCGSLENAVISLKEGTGIIVSCGKN